MFRPLVVLLASSAVCADIESAPDEVSLIQMQRFGKHTDPEPPPSFDWPAAWPPRAEDPKHGPWTKRAEGSITQDVEAFTDENRKYHASMFAKYPLMGSVTLPAGRLKGKRVPFPHTVQDAEGLGFVGTADAAKVSEIMPKPWKPVLTVEGRATWATWKDVERLNSYGQVCQRQWVAFYAQHQDHSFPAVESPIQLLYGQFAGFHFYSYTHQMYNDCEDVVEIDRNMYGWDSHFATHDYHRDIHGNLNWTVTSGGKTIMDMHVSMPYGPQTIFAHYGDLLKYGMELPLAQEPEQMFKFLKQRQQQFHWLSKPGIMPIQDSESLTPVIHSPFGEVDTETYPSTKPGEQWDTNENYFNESYYDESGPFGIKMPMGEDDYLNWHGEFADLDMQTGPEFSLSFFTHHFQMLWNSPWTFVPTNDEPPKPKPEKPVLCSSPAMWKSCKAGAKAGFCPCKKQKCTRGQKKICRGGAKAGFCVWCPPKKDKKLGMMNKDTK